MNILKFSSTQLFLFVFFKLNSLIAAEPPPFNNIVLHKNPLQVSQVKFKDFYLKDIQINTDSINQDQNKININIVFSIKRAHGTLESVGIILE